MSEATIQENTGGASPARTEPHHLRRIGFAIAQNVVLAVLLGFAPVPLYAPYVHLATAPVISSALQDQQLGAGIMWTFGDLPFGIALSILFQRWLAGHMDDASVALPAQPTRER